MSVNRWPLGPRDIKGNTGPLARLTERRYRTHMALDRGYLADPRDAFAFFELMAPVRLASPVSKDEKGEFLVNVRDRTGKEVLLTLPSGRDSLGPSTSVGKGFTIGSPMGTNEDRLNMAVVTFLLEKAPAHRRTRTVHALRASLESRRMRILEEDRSR